jgi:hypothetical protein
LGILLLDWVLTPPLGVVGSRVERVGSRVEIVGSRVERVGSRVERVGSRVERVGSRVENEYGAGDLSNWPERG